MKMGSLVAVGLLLHLPSLASAATSYSWGLPKISTDGGVMDRPGSTVAPVPGGPCACNRQNRRQH